MPDAPAAEPQPGEPTRGETSPLLTTRIGVTHGLRVPMRDGVELALDLLRPDLAGPLPVVLYRTPYDKVLSRGGGATGLPELLARRGYIVATNDCRGRFNSGGVFQPNFNEARDGYDTIQWIAEQEWCDGNIGMLGGSYIADTQWYAASQQPPNLKAIVPISAQPGSLWRNEPIFNGCFMLPMAAWMVGMGDRTYNQSFADFITGWSKHHDFYDAFPLATLAERAGVVCAWWNEWMEHPTYDVFWKQGEKSNHHELEVASLNIAGWWDSNAPGAPLNFEAMGRSAAADRRKLIIGPWPHWSNLKNELSGLDLGDHSVIDLNNYIIRFYDRWLKGIANGIESEKAAYTYIVGANEWLADDQWPPAGVEEVPFFFHSKGNANSLKGDGFLSRDAPKTETPDAFVYDPCDTACVVWDFQEGPVDDRLATLRDDCLCYTSDPLAEPVELVGWVTCRLFASSSARDTDWHARLVDVHPDGTARFICRGALRARFRESLEESVLLEPEKPTLFEFSMDACGIRFLPGHRIRVEIASSWFNLWDRNTNSGAENPWKDDQPIVAHQRVYHQEGLASCVLLPVRQLGAAT